MPDTLSQTIIYTDGAAIGNPGPGGYGAVILSGGKRRELSGGYQLTTNNRMELMAAIKALESLDIPQAVTLYSDSRYLVDSINNGWAKRWQANKWKKADKKKAENIDLWKQLLELLDKHKVTVTWVAGHAGTPENERCDRLAVRAAGKKSLPPDPGYQTDEQRADLARPMSLFDM